MVAGVVCCQGKTPLIIISLGIKINAGYYRESILHVYLEFMKNKDMFPKQNLTTFIQDGAPCDTAKKTIDVIKESTGNSISIWIGKSVWPEILLILM